MTIPSTARKAGPLLGTGAQTAWPFTFKVFAEEDVAVTIADSDGAETALVLGADFSVALNANQETSPGGTVTYPISGAELPVGSVLAIAGALPYDQPLDLPSGGNFSPLAIENQLDRTAMQIQQLAEGLDRAARLPVTSAESVEELVDDLQRIADSADNLDTVAGSIVNVNTVATNVADVNTVAAVAGAVAATGANIAAVVAVGNDLLEPTSEVNTVAGSITNVNTVGDAIADVNTVAGVAANVTTVAGIAANVVTVAANVADVTNFADVYQGAKASDPALRNDGSALQAGDLYFNTAENALRAYSGTVWVAGTAGTISVTSFSGDGVETAFVLPTAPASENNTQVYIGGVYQQKDQYALSGATITFSTAPLAGAGNIEVVTIASLALGETDAVLVGTSAAPGGLWSTVQGFIDTALSSSGAGVIGWARSAVGAVTTTAAKWLGWTPISVFEFMSDAEIASVQAGAFATDVTTKVQAALTAAALRRCKRVIVPAGGYFLTSTLTAGYGVALEGEGFEFTQFYRTGNYGDTLVFGAAGGGGACGPAGVKGIWFRHGTAYTPGDAALDHLATMGAHVRMYGSQRAIIEDCWMWRMPYQIVFEGGLVGTVRNVSVYGVYDNVVPACQEGLAQIYCKKSADYGATVTMLFDGVKLNGSNAGLRNVTLTTADGAVVKAMTELVGSQQGLLIDGGEDIEVRGGYAGGHNEHCILFNPGSTSIIDVRVHNMHFDGARTAQLAFSSAGTAGCLGVTVTSNVFNGELLAGNAIKATSPGAFPVLTNFAISNNACFQHYATNFKLLAADGGTITGNVISSYNTLNAATTDLQWTAAIFCDNAYTRNITISGNTIGGGGNAFDTSTGNTYTYKGVEIGSACVRVAAYGNNYAGIRDGANFRTGVAQTPNQYVQTVAGNYQMLANQDIYIRDYAAVTLNGVFLPAYPVQGREVVLKDGFGNAGTHIISIGTGDGATIDGAATTSVSSNFGSRRLRFNGAQWNVV